jgi:primosomal protein N'
MNGEISALEEEIGEKKYQSYNKNLKEYLKEHYDSDNIDDIEKVSDLAHIRNKVKKDLHDLNKELERQEKENNKNQNSGEPANLEEEQENNGNDKEKGNYGNDNQGNGKGNNGSGKGN